MAPDMHKSTGLPKPPPGATTAPTPNLQGLFMSVVSVGIMVNGFLALEGLGMTQWIEEQVGGHFQFLTIIGLSAAVITMGLGAVSDLFPGITLFRNLKRTVMLIALPLAVVISSIYWTLLLAAPHLILPPAEDYGVGDKPTEPSSSAPAPYRIPLWIDLSLHAYPALVLFLEFYTRERKYRPPVSTWGALLVASVAGVSYASWAEYCASYNGTFPYPFLTLNPFPIRCAIYAGATTLALVAFKGLNALHT